MIAALELVVIYGVQEEPGSPVDQVGTHFEQVLEVSEGYFDFEAPELQTPLCQRALKYLRAEFARGDFDTSLVLAAAILSPAAVAGRIDCYPGYWVVFAVDFHTMTADPSLEAWADSHSNHTNFDFLPCLAPHPFRLGSWRTGTERLKGCTAEVAGDQSWHFLVEDMAAN